MPGVQLVTVGQDEAEQRLDRWFRKRWAHIGQGRVEKMCRKGEIRVDGARVKASTRVAPGQQVRVPPLPDEPAPDRAQNRSEPVVDEGMKRSIRNAVIYQDDDIIVLNKPAGLPVQGGSGQTRHLVQMLPALSFERSDVPRLVHRLDKDTSGVLVLARTGAAATKLTRSFRGRSVGKTYFAAVAGRPNPQAGTIRFGLVKAGGRGDERMHTVHPDRVAETEGARTATTDYMVLEQAGNRMAWVALRPVTGRTHQLRAHMAAIGNPIAGDGKYGGRGQDNLGDGWSAGIGGALSRKLHLHAARLTFEHPNHGRTVSFSAPLPEHMMRTWEMMGWQTDADAVDLSDFSERPF